MPKFKPGDPKPPNSGRRPGVTNKSIVRAREAFTLAFEQIGGIEALARWASRNRDEFYRLYARMIPMELTGPNGGPIRATFAQAVQAALEPPKPPIDVVPSPAEDPPGEVRH